MGADTGLKWQDDGNLRFSRLALCKKSHSSAGPLSNFASGALPVQTTNGSITGRVTDPSKASVPDAKIAAVDTGTNFQYETATNSAGEYALTNLPPGTLRPSGVAPYQKMNFSAN